LELGSGDSTPVYGYAAKKVGAKLVSMEESQQYFQRTVSLIPSELKDTIEVRLSKPREYAYGPFRGTAYSEIPDYPYDFVFVDGPDYNTQLSFNADVIELAQRGLSFDFILDTRTGSAFMYHLLFEDFR
jgi:hypothetical protein